MLFVIFKCEDSIFLFYRQINKKNEAELCKTSSNFIFINMQRGIIFQAQAFRTCHRYSTRVAL